MAEKVVLGQGLQEVPVNSRIALEGGRLAELHGDPVDRIIIATALGGYRLLTADKKLLAWAGKLDRADARL